MNPINNTGVFSLRPATDPTAKIIFTGDFAATEVTRDRFRNREYEAMLGGIKPELASADLRVIDVELPLVSEATGFVKAGIHKGLYGPAETVESLKYVGTDVANLANNHVLDQGPEGVKNTMTILKTAGIKTFGAGMNAAEAGAPLVMDVKGIRVTMVAYAQPEGCQAGAQSPGANEYQPERLIEDMKRLRKGTDVLIACVHAGCEMTPIPDLHRVETFRKAVEAGADAVIAHHPHVPQGVEVRGRSLIAYSLGNFSFLLGHMSHIPLCARSFSMELEFDKKGLAGGRVIPHRTTPKEDVVAMTGREKAFFLKRLEEMSALIADDEKLRRYYAASCWLLWTTEYIPWVEARVKKNTLEQNFHFLAGWVAALDSVQIHLPLVRTIAAMEKSGGVNKEDLEYVRGLGKFEN